MDANKDDFFAAILDSPRREAFTLPNGKILWVHEISAAEFVELQIDIAKASKDGQDRFALARLIQKCVCTDSGKPVFASTDEDLAKIMSGRQQIVADLWLLCREVNGLNREEVKKNSDPAQSLNSPTASPTISAA